MTQPTATPHVERPVTVLLIDDQPIVAESVRRMLADQPDVRFHYCQDPAKAIETGKIADVGFLHDVFILRKRRTAAEAAFRLCARPPSVPIACSLSSQDDRQIIRPKRRRNVTYVGTTCRRASRPRIVNPEP